MSALLRFDERDKQREEAEAEWYAWQRAGRMAEIDGREELLTRAEMDKRQMYYYERFRALQRQYGSSDSIA